MIRNCSPFRVIKILPLQIEKILFKQRCQILLSVVPTSQNLKRLRKWLKSARIVIMTQ